MIRNIYLFVLVAFSGYCNAQTSQTRFYNNQWLQKEVPERKAKFSRTITQNSDSTETTAIKDLRSGEIYSSQTYKGEEPFGIWINQRSNKVDTLDYSFHVKYGSFHCEDTIPRVTDILSDNEKYNYKAPVLEGGINISQFISNNVIYPARARENGIVGRVFLSFVLSEKGQIEDVVVIKNTHLLLDKEAVRVIRLLKFKSLPELNGQPHAICLNIPLSFSLK